MTIDIRRAVRKSDRSRMIVLCAIVLIGAVFFASQEACARDAEKMRVAVSIAPQKYFAERVGGETVDVTVLVPPGADLHTYEIKPRQMVALSRAVLYFTIGVRFEHGLVGRIKGLHSGLVVIGTDDGIEKRAMESHRRHNGHDHDDHNHDDHGLHDPHVWLSPLNALVMARSMRDAFVAADPSRESVYTANCEALERDIIALDNELTAMFRDCRGVSFMVFHPAWGYFADAYGLRQVAVEVEGREPRPADLGRLIREARESDVSAIFIQPQMSDRSARTVADAVGAVLVVADPLNENWLENIRGVARRIHEAIR